MKTVANQKTVNVVKAESNKDNYYCITNLDALRMAMINLKGETFKLWCYLNKNQNGYTLALSKVDAISWGIGSKSSYDRAVKDLIEQGYLVETSKGHYDFYEYPKEEVIEITINNSNECGFAF